jgi:hypothetical protein
VRLYAVTGASLPLIARSPQRVASTPSGRVRRARRLPETTSSRPSRLVVLLEASGGVEDVADEHDLLAGDRHPPRDHDLGGARGAARRRG